MMILRFLKLEKFSFKSLVIVRKKTTFPYKIVLKINFSMIFAKLNEKGTSLLDWISIDLEKYDTCVSYDFFSH